jgi:hypothetical protein
MGLGEQVFGKSRSARDPRQEGEKESRSSNFEDLPQNDFNVLGSNVSVESMQLTLGGY